ncbi:MAG: hypothetical protein ACI823_000822, partial [Chitinophagales bacterium]
GHTVVYFIVIVMGFSDSFKWCQTPNVLQK